ncbi:hypothetical protein K3175_03910 [Qipengyuania sp. GH1]|uniref:TonB-dependent receptor plug domain-containing protein n=1 Tax=Qipengyuania aestuarii TaxID=2867241 RepID=UPI001C87A905|nr:hypothetical protein [Qipengyuania aestuarii]MBX7534797.1 hypothetical protein [Qipengyuania aestuarii]
MPSAIAQEERPVEQQLPEPAPDEPTVDEGDIVVYGTRLKGQLIVDQPPIAEYDEADIAAFGANSIADLLEALEPATGSSARGGRGGGRPVFLLNGIRVSSSREFRSYPPEAVAKIEVFPEEVAQRFGYSADQRVVNIILKPDFQSLTAEVEYEQPGIGGYSRNEQEATWLRIGEKGRLNISVEAEDRSLLTEAERDVTPARSAEEAPFRSLISDTFGFQADANYARAFIESGTSFNLNGTFEHDETRSLSGLAIDGTTPLERRGNTDSVSAGLSINKPLGDWIATFTSDNNYARGLTEIDRNDASGFDTARSRNYTTANKLTLNGFPLELPAGELSTTLDLNLDWNRIESEDTRSDADLGLSRRRLGAGLTVNLPVARRGDPLGAIGDIGLTATAGVDDLSDFGTLANWSLGVNWSPFENLSLSGTRIWREVAPSLTNLGSPRIDELNSTVFDYRTGQTVLATVITGGNPDLQEETQSDWKFSANWELPFWENTRFNVDYGINRSRDVTSSPGFSSAFEQAFPDRVSRDDAGELLAIDRRPLTLYQTRSRILSFGLNTRGQIGKEPQPAASGDRARVQSNSAPTGGFDPSRMEAIRKVFCETPEGGTPDLSQLPDMFRARLLDENGNPDPEKITAARARFCGAEAEKTGERFAAMRAAICADPPELDSLPEEMLARLRNENGEIDAEKLAALRERMCSASGDQNAPTSQPRGAGGRGAMFGGGEREDNRARYFLSLSHDVTLENEVLLSQDGPLFDQLDGLVLGGGALPRNTSRFQGGIFWQGYGLRLSGQYVGDAVLRGGDFPGSSDLFFSDLATFDLRLFANLGEVFEKEDGWLDGLRVSLVADNVFDARRRVTDENGDVPTAYEPFRIDPTGRYLGIDIRKAF